VHDLAVRMAPPGSSIGHIGTEALRRPFMT